MMSSRNLPFPSASSASSSDLRAFRRLAIAESTTLLLPVLVNSRYMLGSTAGQPNPRYFSPAAIVASLFSRGMPSQAFLSEYEGNLTHSVPPLQNCSRNARS